MIWALGLAGTQAAGVREMFGSMGKAFHPGRAAQNGYGAALLAQAGFTSGPRILEGPRGFSAVTTAAKFNLANVTKGLGTEFDLLVNTYKPYPCGIVIHPTIDGAIQLREQHGVAPADIAAVRLRVAPLVLDLCNQQGITTGLQGKFSVYHGAAIGLVRGKAGVQEYTDAAVNDPDIKRVREAATATADPARHRGSGGRRGGAARRPPPVGVRRAVARQHQQAAERSPARRQVPRPGGGQPAGRRRRAADRAVLEDRGSRPTSTKWCRRRAGMRAGRGGSRGGAA